MLESFLIKLCEELSLPATSFEKKKGRISLNFREDLQMECSALNPGLSLQTSIAPCPEQQREDLFLYLMRGNLLGQGARGARFGLTQDEKFLTLSLGLPYEMNYTMFRETFEDFANYALYWREEIERFLINPISM